jgi:two-component system sensor histidine kinase ChvG
MTTSSETRAPARTSASPSKRRATLARIGERLRAFGRLVFVRASSSLVRRIVVLNLAGLVAMLAGILYLNQFRAGLIEARVQSLKIQGEIMAGAIASSATVEVDSITIDPDRLLQLQAGESIGVNEEILEFSINPERVAPLMRRLVTPTRVRARVYDREGTLLLDSRALYSRGDILRFDLPPPSREDTTFFERLFLQIKKVLGFRPPPFSEEIIATNGRNLAEVMRALSGQTASLERTNALGQTIVSVAVPIQRFRAVRGVLLLSTQGGDIDAIISAERMAIFRIFAVAAGVMLIVSALFAGTIAGPIRRLSAAADRVRRGVKARIEIPDFTDRSDEIGHLSGSLRDMTRALYNRIEAIESFAADVAHELKNPLTSLRSAVETLPLARNEDSRARLLAIIQHDVRRLDRLISDISDASRLDAELARTDAEPVDLVRLAETVVAVQNEVKRASPVFIRLAIAPHPMGRDAYIVPGHDLRLGQVITNIVDNACSFSPEGGEVRVFMQREPHAVTMSVEDDGPGIPPHALERIFERFYTDRPEEQGFGQNSGLGLSISRQIVEAHRGTIAAENRLGPTDADGEATRLGARFIVRLPAQG